MPSGPFSLKEKGTPISRPSNSGIATCIAASIGDSAASDSCQAARDEVRQSPSQHRDVQPRQAHPRPSLFRRRPRLALRRRRPPAASTVATTASQRLRPPAGVRLVAGQAAQRAAEHRQQHWPGRLHRVGQRVHEARVPGQRVRPVERRRPPSAGPRRAGARRERRSPECGPAPRSPRPSATPCPTGSWPARPGWPGRPRPGTPAPASTTPAGTVEAAISSASGVASPPRQHRRLHAGQDRREALLPGPFGRPAAAPPPGRRRPAAPGRSSTSSRAGLPIV